MLKIFLLTLLIALAGCSDQNEDLSMDSSPNNVVDKDRSYSFQELTNVCVEGCLYHDTLYRGANKIKPRAVSLNTVQLDSIGEACTFFCQDEVFRKINQKNNIKAITDLHNEPKKQTTDIKEDKEEPSDEIEYDFGFSSPKKDRKEEEKPKKVDKPSDSSLKPFEDL